MEFVIAGKSYILENSEWMFKEKLNKGPVKDIKIMAQQSSDFDYNLGPEIVEQKKEDSDDLALSFVQTDKLD